MNVVHNGKSLLACAALALAAGDAAAQSLTVTTTASGSLTHSLGSAVAKVVTETTDIRLIVQPQGGNALNPLNNKAAEFGFHGLESPPARGAWPRTPATRAR